MRMQRKVPTYWNVRTQQVEPGRWWEELREQRVQERAGGGWGAESGFPSPDGLGTDLTEPALSSRSLRGGGHGGRVLEAERCSQPLYAQAGHQGPVCTCPWELTEALGGRMEGHLSLHLSYQFSNLGPHSHSLNWLESTSRSPKPWKYVVMRPCFWSWLCQGWGLHW